MKHYILTITIAFASIFLRISLPVGGLDLCELEGYVMYECTSVNGEFEGEDGDLVQLQNGMIFKLTSYAYNYGYSPEVAVFARQFNYAGRDLIFYKLLVEDEVYDAERLK